MNGVNVVCDGVVFPKEKIRNTKIVQEIDPISSEISINTANITIDAESGEEIFANGKAVLVYFNDNLVCKTFISSSKKKSENTWEIKSEDYIALLDDVVFVGGVYEKKDVEELISEILNTAGVPFSISGFEGEIVWGHIPYTNCRDALKQVAFAVGAVIDTSNSELIKIYKLDKRVSQTIPKSRILQGVSAEKKLPKKQVSIIAHQYYPSGEIEVLYENKSNSVKSNFLVVFNDIYRDLLITNGEILEPTATDDNFGVNYAIIDAGVGCSLSGERIDHERFENQETQTGESVEGVTSVSDATLVYPLNVAEVLNRCVNFFSKKQKIKAKIIEGKHEKQNGFVLYGEKKYGEFFYGQRKDPEYEYDQQVKVGETIVLEMPYGQNIQGVVTKQTYNLNGGIIIKDTELVGDYIGT